MAEPLTQQEMKELTRLRLMEEAGNEQPLTADELREYEELLAKEEGRRPPPPDVDIEGILPPGSVLDARDRLGFAHPGEQPGSTIKRADVPETPTERGLREAGEFVGRWVLPVESYGVATDPEAAPLLRSLGALDVGLTALPPAKLATVPAKAALRKLALREGPRAAGQAARKGLMETAPRSGKELAAMMAAGGAGGVAHEGLEAAGVESPTLKALAAMGVGIPAAMKLAPKTAAGALEGVAPGDAAMIARAQAMDVPLSPGAKTPQAAMQEAGRVAADPSKFGHVAQQFREAQDVAARAGLAREAGERFGPEFAGELAEGAFVRGKGAAKIEPELAAKRQVKGKAVGEAEEKVLAQLPVAKGLGKSIGGKLDELAKTPGSGKALRKLLQEYSARIKKEGTSAKGVQAVMDDFVTDADSFFKGGSGRNAKRIATEAKNAMKGTMERWITRAAKSAGKGTEAHAALKKLQKAKAEARPVIQTHDVVEGSLVKKRTGEVVADEDILKVLTQGKFGKDRIQKLAKQLKPQTLTEVQADAAKTLLQPAMTGPKLSAARLRTQMKNKPTLTAIMSPEQRKSLNEMAEFLEWLERPRTAAGKMPAGAFGGSPTQVRQQLAQLAPNWIKSLGRWGSDFVRKATGLAPEDMARRYFKEGVPTVPKKPRVSRRAMMQLPARVLAGDEEE